MARKIWEKDTAVDCDVESYTVGRDREMDLYLAPYDVLGSMAHITMLESINLLSADELTRLLEALRGIYGETQQGTFVIEEGVEDVHSQVELMLTRQLGDMGKKSTPDDLATTRCSWISNSSYVPKSKNW